MDDLERRRTHIEDRLEEVIAEMEPSVLRDQVEHVTLSGGKRVRPTVTVLVCDALDGDMEAAVRYAIGIELIHNASLVIDDIIDESALRRNVPSAWMEFGHGPAITSSDGMIGRAFSLFTTDARAMRAVSEAMVQLSEGEATELVDKPSNEEEYSKLARRKTGSLFRAAAELGAIAAEADTYTVEAVGQYAERVGIAFQMRDDVLDATADAEQLGKPTGHDAEMDRPSIVEVTDLTPEEANRRAREESEKALDALESAEVTDTEAATYLREFANFVVERDR